MDEIDPGASRRRTVQEEETIREGSRERAAHPLPVAIEHVESTESRALRDAQNLRPRLSQDEELLDLVLGVLDPPSRG